MISFFNCRCYTDLFLTPSARSFFLELVGKKKKYNTIYYNPSHTIYTLNPLCLLSVFSFSTPPLGLTSPDRLFFFLWHINCPSLSFLVNLLSGSNNNNNNNMTKSILFTISEREAENSFYMFLSR